MNGLAEAHPLAARGQIQSTFAELLGQGPAWCVLESSDVKLISGPWLASVPGGAALLILHGW